MYLRGIVITQLVLPAQFRLGSANLKSHQITLNSIYVYYNAVSSELQCSSYTVTVQVILVVTYGRPLAGKTSFIIAIRFKNQNIINLFYKE